MNDSTKYTSLAAVVIVIAAALTIVKLLNAVPLLSANDRSRWATVWSIVERQTYAIDEIDARSGWSTIDKVRFEDHYYSTKPPLLPRLAAEVTAGVEMATGLSLDQSPRAASRLVLLVVNVIPTVVSWCVLAWMLPKFSRSLWACLFALSVACFATLNSAFVVTFNNHSVAIWALTLTLGCMTWMTAAGPKTRWVASGLAGLFAAWTCCNEMPAAPFGVLTFLWAWRRDWRLAWFAFVPMALIPLGGFFYTNWEVTGTWKPFQLTYGTETYRHIVDGIPSYWMRPAGLDTNPDSTPTYLLHCTIGHHGMLSLTPVFLWTVLVWLGFGKKLTDAKKSTTTSGTRNQMLTPDEAASKPTEVAKRKADASPIDAFQFVRHAGLLLTAITTAFYLSKTENYNYGGTSCALRWTLWLTPLWTVGMLPMLVSVSKSRLGRVFACVLLAASVGSAWYPAANPWQHPWIYQTMREAGWVQAPAPVMAPLEPMHSWIQSLPLAGTSATYRVAGLHEKTVTLKVLDRNEGSVRLSWTDEDRSIEFVVDESAFNANMPIDDWLVKTSADRNDTITKLRGLPLERAYAPGKRGYVKTPAFDDHRSTWRMASRVYDKRSRHITRSDIWVAADDELTGNQAAEVPYGLVQMVITTSSRSGAFIAREIWTLVDFSDGQLEDGSNR